MKVFAILFAIVFSILAPCFADEPSLSVYQIIREDMDRGESGELILKLSTPPGKTYYTLGLGITDVPRVIEVQRNGKWVVLPEPRCLTGARMRPLLPDSYLVFDAFLMSFAEEDYTFRVRVFLYTTPDRTNPYTDPDNKPYIEVVSPPFSTKDFKSLKPRGEPPKIPGLDAIPNTK